MPAQQGSPIFPQAPPEQPPALHWVPSEQALPLITHIGVAPARRSQQPPPAQELPSQHGWPGPPHIWQRDVV
jgi:hypothetical protein